MVIFLFIGDWAEAVEYQKQQLKFANGKTLTVEVADSPEKRANGLMNRTQLNDDQGMLFIFDQPQQLSFWMKDTFIPLSIAYFDEDKKLKEIYDMKEQNMMERVQDVDSYPSKCRCQYALEVNKGWFEKNKINQGQSFQLMPLKK